jgi:hypothetical protein
MLFQYQQYGTDRKDMFTNQMCKLIKKFRNKFYLSFPQHRESSFSLKMVVFEIKKYVRYTGELYCKKLCSSNEIHKLKQ